MTISFGKGVKNKEDLGKSVNLTVTDLGLSDMAMAVKLMVMISNDIAHITIAINPNGGKPVMSNQIKWQNIKPFIVVGIVTDIMLYNLLFV
jgi:hypothetical protein